MTVRSIRLLAAALAASTCLALPAAGHAAGAAAPEVLGQSVPAPAQSLRRFAVGAEALTFSGEHAVRDFPLYVSASETADSAKLVLSVQSAVSDLPEASEMVVLVNNKPVGKSRLGEADRVRLAFDLPAGLLQPGFNAVSIIVAQTHRADCSIPATYELWTRIDPLESGVLLAGARRPVHDFADLGGLDRNASGQFVIRGRLAPDASIPDVERMLSAIQSFVVAAGIDRPLVEFNEFAGSGPGLDVVVGPSRGAISTQRGTGLSFVSFDAADAQRRPTLFVSGESEQQLADNLGQFARFAASVEPAGSPEGVRALLNYAGRPLAAGDKVEIGALGFREASFSGRFYNDQVVFNLPADFYAADYGDAAVNLDAAYAPNLLRSAQFIVRANGAIVSTLGLSSFRGGTLSSQRLPIPLSKLRPGRNVVSFEARVPTASDQVCDTGLPVSREARLFVSGKTTLEIPTLARVGHAPDIAAMAAGLSQIGPKKTISAFIPTPAGPSLEAAGTFFAAVAASTRRILPVEILTSAPARSSGEMVAFGKLAELPPEMLSYVGLRQPGGLDGGAQFSYVPAEGMPSAPAALSPTRFFSRAGEWLGVSPAQAAAPEAGTEAKLAVLGRPFDLSERLQEMRSGAETLGQDAAAWAWKMIKLDEAEEGARYQMSDKTALVLAQRPAPTAEGAAWTVVAARSDAELLSGVAAITAPERWGKLGGAITALSAETGDLTTVNARSERLYETQPRSLENGRLVLAGWFSRHSERYVLGILAVFLLLGLSTHLFLRSVGGKNR